MHGPEASLAKPVTEDAVEAEISYTLASIDRVKLNESAWNYLAGIRRKYRDSMPVVMTLSIHDRYVVFPPSLPGIMLVVGFLKKGGVSFVLLVSFSLLTELSCCVYDRLLSMNESLGEGKCFYLWEMLADIA